MEPRLAWEDMSTDDVLAYAEFFLGLKRTKKNDNIQYFKNSLKGGNWLPFWHEMT